MKRSTERILTTHAGSLPRPPEILQLVEGRDQREVLGHAGASELIDQAVKATGHRQVEVGIDVPSDGEVGRVGFSAYATHQLTGFDGPPSAMCRQDESTLLPECHAA